MVVAVAEAAAAAQMEFHASGVNDNVVEVMACTDELCRQLKVTVPLGTPDAEKRVEQALTRLFALVGDKALQHKTLEGIEAALLHSNQ